MLGDVYKRQISIHAKRPGILRGRPRSSRLLVSRPSTWRRGWLNTATSRRRTTWESRRGTSRPTRRWSSLCRRATTLYFLERSQQQQNTLEGGKRIGLFQGNPITYAHTLARVHTATGRPEGPAQRHLGWEIFGQDSRPQEEPRTEGARCQDRDASSRL